jgi:AcrR family transcriptional regulator
MAVSKATVGSPAARQVAKRCRNRPLDRTKDTAITAAVLDVLSRVGYSGLTMDEVAEVAGVGKAAIYRRWTSKDDLLVRFIDEAIIDVLVVVDTGSLRSDMVVLLNSVVAHMESPAGRANRALLSAIHDDPALAEAFYSGPLARWSAAFDELFDRAVERGEIAPGAGTSVAAEAGPAILMQRWLLGAAPLGGELVTTVVDRVMLPLLRPEDQREGRRPRTTRGRTRGLGAVRWNSSRSHETAPRRTGSPSAQAGLRSRQRSR